MSQPRRMNHEQPAAVARTDQVRIGLPELALALVEHRRRTQRLLAYLDRLEGVVGGCDHEPGLVPRLGEQLRSSDGQLQQLVVRLGELDA